MKNNNIKFRVAKEKDYQKVNDLAKQEHDFHVELRPDLYVSQKTVISKTEFLKLLNEAVILVGEAENQVISYAICGYKYISNPLMTKKKIMFIEAFGVAVAYQRRGLGKAMMQQIIAIAKENACNKIELIVNSKNEKAVTFYQQLKMQERLLTLEKNL